MLIDEQVGLTGHTPTSPPSAPALSLATEAPALYADLRVAPFLRRLLARSGSLLQGAAGSISLVDGGGQRYHKVAEQGALCQLGRSFSLDEGVTGRVVARRAPVVLGRYSDVAGAHLPDGHRARNGSVVAVPIWWRGDVLGANVCFAGVERSFRTDEVDDLEVLSQLAAAGIVRSSLSDPALAPLGRPADAVAPDTPAGVGSETGASSPFTDRELQVAALMATGRRDRDIAEALVISPRTVEKHVASVLRKTGSTHRIPAILRCVAEGWVAPP